MDINIVVLISSKLLQAKNTRLEQFIVYVVYFLFLGIHLVVVSKQRQMNYTHIKSKFKFSFFIFIMSCFMLTQVTR